MRTGPETGALLDIIADPMKSTAAARPGARGGVWRRLMVAICVMSGLMIAGAVAATGQSAGSAQPPGPAPAGTTSELMVKIIYPASDAIFYISTRTPATDVEWNDLQGKALMV